jgi:hypothetical protein
MLKWIHFYRVELNLEILMKNLFLLLLLSVAIFGFNSCEKIAEENNNGDTSEAGTGNNLKATVVSYDNFYDGMDWTFTSSPAIPATSGTWTLCGYSANSRWGRLSWNWASCPLYPSLVTSSGGYINLQVPGSLQKKGAQIESIRNDYWYGSYRAKMKSGAHSGSDTQGSCTGFFYYNSATEQEIDVEILSYEHLTKKVHFTTHPGNYTLAYVLPSDPTSAYIEYGFDWYSNKVDFFINGVKVKTQTLAVPTTKGKIILNNWTGNTWAGAPSPSVSNLSVDYIWHAPFLLVTYPDVSGIIWKKRSSKTITWNRYGDASSNLVNVELWKNGALYQVIKSGAANTGSLIWTIPTTILSANNYQIKIHSALNSNYFDFSNTGFTIQ